MGEKSLSASSVGSALGKAARSFGDGRNGRRVVRGLWAGGRTFLASLGRIARILWLEVTGLVFLLFSLVGAVACTKEYRAFVGGKVSVSRALLAGVFSLMFGYFGLSSFWKARSR